MTLLFYLRLTFSYPHSVFLVDRLQTHVWKLAKDSFARGDNLTKPRPETATHSHSLTPIMAIF
ncbi:uncharacterized protein PHALS_10023 [Plasmopara halstedii]|uniref:Uncharacterized protein n=1 Tax=Plasmopara halstedii TaxID=4781 RepID=A0A0N7L4W2_PLAHL|nr:uncharacterized protein PHALS_10023 [Plasmopara halstedii]CEG39787.1 hypothetical protein PHALS_10023 [Plasmopara halstedii]|eukprot:XP_024576156.1 hypothetical protein PHALS_10023 [Plasmopara halstedii]